jgi:non-haem dioxygenase in morphine synthesis N-terminal
VIEEMKDDIKEFFDLPLEKREEVAQLPGDLEGYGHAFVLSEEQKLDWADMFFLFTQPPHFRNFKHWPSQPTSFRSHSEKKMLIFPFKSLEFGIGHPRNDLL